jgi:glycyl-tRNA synthetase beta chain
VGVAFDTADAVMASGWSRLPSLVARARALEKVRVADEFRALALAFKRVRNITDGQPDGEVDPLLFEQDDERELHEAVTTFHGELERLLPERRVDDAFAAMIPIAEVLDRFFVEVLVMVEDDTVRGNRIALLKQLGTDFSELADLSKLQVEGGD